MAAVDKATLEMLKEMGACKASFFPDGSIASVDFGPDTNQHEIPNTSRDDDTPATLTRHRSRSTGQLVPRARTDSD